MTAVLWFAAGFVAVGMVLLCLMVYHWREDYSPVLNIATWFFLSLPPPIVLFTLDPASRAEGEISRFTVSGAFAAFIITFVVATRTARQLHIQTVQNRAAPTARRSKSLHGPVYHEFCVTSVATHRLLIVSGQLREIRDFDIWVNSENTNLQMARFHDESISGAIRYLGAERANGKMVRDTIAEELKSAVRGELAVDPATVVTTGAGGLAHSNGVKAILHVASVHGQPGRGYQQIGAIEDCIHNLFAAAGKINGVHGPMTSMLIPLLGTGTAHADLRTTAQRLFSATVGCLQDSHASPVTRVGFLVSTQHQRDVCLEVLKHDLRLQFAPISAAKSGGRVEA